MKPLPKKKSTALPVEPLIRVIRGREVMLDEDLARLYGVTTKVLNQGVKRNIERFPDDFMFQLTPKEAAVMRSQFVTASKRNVQYQSFAFTEQGVAMLSSVLRSPRAIRMNIAIMRAFVGMRSLASTSKEFAVRLEKLERGQGRAGDVIEILAEDIERLGQEVQDMKKPSAKAGRRIGYIHFGDEAAE